MGSRAVTFAARFDPRAVAWAAAGAVAALALAVWAVRVGPHVTSSTSGRVFTDTSRSLGIAALVVLCGALPLGLVVGRPWLRIPRVTRQVRAFHQALGLSGLALLVAHVVALLGAGSLRPTVVRLVVPFAWHYRSLTTTLGVVGAWMVLVLGPSYFARRRLGVRRWRVVHPFITVGLLLGILHTVGGG
jgi:methionine sulfoxide reductase heme-binding subunit